MLRRVVRVAVGWSTVMLFGKVPRIREPSIIEAGWPLSVPTKILTVAGGSPSGAS
jgi:hypothetical protein